MTNKSPKSMSEAKRERQATMLDMLVNNPGKGYMLRQLATYFKVSKSTIVRDAHDIASLDSKMLLTAGHICYDGDTKNVTAESSNKYDFTKTEEGYSDPTAATAIFNSDAPEPSATADDMIPKPGEVWDVQMAANKKGTMKVIVLAVTTDASCPFVTCVEYSSPKFDVLKAKKIYSKPLKYFMAKCWDVSPVYLYDIRTTIRDYLGIEPEIVTQVEKVEAPVMTGTPATDSEPAMRTYTQDELDLILAEQKAEIYAKCFFAAVKKA